ncbi:C40 family peptidase [Streptomyces sp. NPDC006512]|uniref:C40 family peptidase n=1 Tax=Streptomyces sp. NPDC006512 TaxID=3154307 RepID=UPI0033B71551
MFLAKIALTCAAAAALTAVAPPPGAPAAAAAGAAPRPCAGAPTCYVDVSVAEVWTDPARVRRVDAPATANPVDMRAWLEDMTLDEQRRIPGETQALHGTEVTVEKTVERDGLLWDYVWVHGQPTPKDRAGRGAYPGWIPDRQLTSDHRQPPGGTREARISRPTAWGYSTAADAASAAASGRSAEYSYNTSFPVQAGPVPGVVEARSGDGSRLFFRAADLAPVPADPTGEDVVAAARTFLGLPYVWAGASGFGYDCSGLVSQVYSMLGLVVPRDAQPQFDAGGGRAPAGSAEGERITGTQDLRPGDVVAFRSTTGGAVSHVGVFTGMRNGEPMMINAPGTGEGVREEPLDGTGRVYAGATRFLPSPSLGTP